MIPKDYSADKTFVIGKRRVAPMRYLSIPQLELQAVVMAVRLKKQIVKENEMKIQFCSFWSDSITVLQWIHNFHRKQQVFVANREVEILDTLMFHSGDMLAVSTIQRILARERSTMKNSGGVSGSLGRSC